MKKFLLILIILFNMLIHATKISLPFVFKPDTIVVGSDRIFISSFPNIFLLSLPEGKLLKKFGKQGEGPGEFKLFIRFHRHPDYLIVSSSGKMSYFTKTGEFIREFRVPGNNVFKPVGDHYAGYRVFDEKKSKITYVAIDIFNSKFQKIKEISRTKFKFQYSRQKIFTIRNQGSFRVDKNMIIVNGAGGEILIFNEEGEKIRSFKPAVERISVTEKDKSRYKGYYRNYPEYKQYYEAAQKWFRFPEYFPLIHEIYVADGKIYAETHERKDGKRAFLILDIQGNLLQKVFLNVAEINPIEKHIYTFKNNRFYQLVENEEREETELHITDLK